jgi:hypothetical protein
VVIIVSNAENLGKCPRCHMTVIAEELTSHTCHIPTRNAETIYLDWLDEEFVNADDDRVRMAKGLNGTLYRIILCKHNPPHSFRSRWLTGKDDESKRPPDKLPVYL